VPPRFLLTFAMLSVGLVGCGDEETTTIIQTAAPQTVTETTTSGEAPAGGGQTTTAPSGSVDFRSPTGNIVCHVDSDSATCGIRDFNFTPPPQPPTCDLPGWGHNIEVGTAGQAAFACQDEIPAPPDSPALPYGNYVQTDNFECGSTRIGVYCESRQTKHGFAVSRERYGLN
jgi:hypothetical protein